MLFLANEWEIGFPGRNVLFWKFSMTVMFVMCSAFPKLKKIHIQCLEMLRESDNFFCFAFVILLCMSRGHSAVEWLARLTANREAGLQIPARSEIC